MRQLIIPSCYRSVLTYLLLVFLAQVPHLIQGQHKQQERVVMALFDSLEAKARLYSDVNPIEKIHIHFDKTVYALGEESWYRAYVVRGSDLRATDISSVLYVDWISPSGSVVQHQRLKIENGGAIGDFTINASNEDGMYTVRAYTNWMRNDDPDLFFTKKIQVFNPRRGPSANVSDTSIAKIDVQFFPEGGTLVAGIKTQIAFKAIDIQGKGVDVSGRIIDDQNNFVTSFRSVHNGMGIFPLITEGQRSYRAVLQNGDVLPLSQPATEGLVLGVSNLNPEKIFVSVQAPAGYQHEMAYLVGHSRGSICYEASIKIDKHSKAFSIAKNVLPEGVLQLTLFDSEGIPQCQRKVFIKKDGARTIAIDSDKERFSPRDSIMLKFKISDPKGESDSTSLSVSVTDADFIDGDPLSENIYTRLLLQSDLKGYVEKPGWYFESNAADRAYMLDIVMLTHGWSRYDWKKILSPTYLATFSPEKGITLKGRILARNKPMPDVPFVLTIPKQYENNFQIYQSDSLGRFVIADLTIGDSTLVLFRVMGKKKGAVENAVIELDTLQDPPPPVEHIASQPQSGRNELFDKLLARFLKTGVWNLNDVRVLDEIVIKAKRLDAIAVSRLGIVVKPRPEDMKLTAYQFVSRYALNLPFSKLVTAPDGEERWTGVWIYVDGWERKGNPVLELNSIPADEIDQVIVSGTPRHGYFISITTKDPPPEDVSGTIERFVKGFDVAREFYHPKYGPMDASTFGPDNRVTLYWNPHLLTTSDGTATIKFYNTDSTRRLLVTVEGVADGVPVFATKILGRE